MKADIQDVLITVARIDEKVKTIFNRQSSIEKRVNSMDEKINQISPLVKFGERFFWLVVMLIRHTMNTYPIPLKLSLN